MSLSIQHPAAPGAYLCRNDQPPAVIAVRTDIAGFVGIAERGPIGVAVPVESMRQFQSVFGDYIGGGFLAYSLRAFFENGGRRARVVRVASDDPDQGAAAASVQIASAIGPWTIAASSSGSWGNGLSIELVERKPGQAIVDQASSDPSYAVVPSTSGFVANSLVRLTQAGTVPQVRVVAAVDPAQRRIYWLDPNPERRSPRQMAVTGFNPNVTLLAESLSYDLVVYRQMRLATLNQSLSLVPESASFAGALLQPIDFSRFDTPPGALPLVTVIPPPLAPSTVPAPLDIVSGATLPLAGGQDGLAVLTQDDFIGDAFDASYDAAGNPILRGLAVLGEASDVSVLAVPDILIRPVPPPVFIPAAPVIDPCPVCQQEPPPAPWIPPIPPELPPIFPDSAILAVQAAMLAQCEALGERVALLDPPWDTAADASLGVAPVQAWRDNFDSKFGGLYFPWLAAPDPARAAPTRALPPSGHVAGQIAATDLSVGVHKAPANADVAWVQDVTVPVSPGEHGVLNTEGVNVIRGDSGRSIRIMGARTVSSDPFYRFLNVRRLLCMMRRALALATNWVVFEPNGPHLRATLTATVAGFLQQLWTQGALSGRTPAAAYQVVCDDSNNPPSLQAQGQLVLDLGVAPTVPFEFVLMRLGRANDSLDIQERGMLAAGSG